MADGPTREDLDKSWWDRWWQADYSWAGLSRKEIEGDGGLHGEKTLQDYWRRDPKTGDMRDDDAMRRARELIELEGTLFHIAHLPPLSRTGEQSFKGKLDHPEWERLQALIAARVGDSRETKFTDDFPWRPYSKDGRIKLRGTVLRGAITQPQAFGDPLHLDCSQTAILGKAGYFGSRFGPGISFSGACFTGVAAFDCACFADSADFGNACFTDVVEFWSAKFAGHANFANARFAGGVNFTDASFFGDTSFRHAAFAGSADFPGVTFTGNASFTHAIFSNGCSFWGDNFTDRADFESANFTGDAYFGHARFNGQIDFINARFDDLAFFEKIAWPEHARDWHAAFTRTLFRGPAVFRDSGFKALAAFDGALFERGLDFDEVSEVKADTIFKAEHKATRAAAEADAKDWAQEQLKESTSILKHLDPAAKKAKPIRPDEMRQKVDERHQIRLKQLERGCRVLKQAMEKASDKTREQILYRYELIARRSQRDTPAWERFFSSIYDFASNYGGSIARPLGVIVYGSALFGLVYWMWYRGFGVLSDLLAIVKAPLSETAWAPLIEGLSLSASRIFPFGPWGVETSAMRTALLGDGATLCSFLFRLVATFQSLAAGVLVFLCALAVRRRFQIS